ncbi:MAG: archease [Oligoflexia bacterium]|nr:archease [Oligoflexia bacterium]
MPFRFVEEITWADVAIEATGGSLEELFLSACAATLEVMLDEPATLRAEERREFVLESQEATEEARIEELLHDLLQKIVFFKDAEALFLRVERLRFENGLTRLHVSGSGERIDRERHALGTDVKSVTLHRFKVERAGEAWRCLFVLDI